MLDFSSLTLCPFPPSWPHVVLCLSFRMFCLLRLVKLFSTFFLNFLFPSLFPLFFSCCSFFPSFSYFFYSSSILSSISAQVTFFPILQIFFIHLLFLPSFLFVWFFQILSFLFFVVVVSIKISRSLASPLI